MNLSIYFTSLPQIYCFLLCLSSHSFCFQLLVTYLKKYVMDLERSGPMHFYASSTRGAMSSLGSPHTLFINMFSCFVYSLILCDDFYKPTKTLLSQASWLEAVWTSYFKRVSNPMIQVKSMRTVNNRIRLEGALKYYPIHLPAPRKS